MTTHDETRPPLWARPADDLDATAERPAVRADLPSYAAPAGSGYAAPAFEAHGHIVDVPQSPAGPSSVLDPTEEHAARAGAPSWWHRSHPVFTPLTGFFTGLLTVIVLPIGYAALLTQLFGDAKVKGLLPFGALVLLIPLVLLVPRPTRRFGRYMLFGMVATAIVVIAVAALTVWFLLNHDG